MVTDMLGYLFKSKPKRPKIMATEDAGISPLAYALKHRDQTLMQQVLERGVELNKEIKFAGAGIWQLPLMYSIRNDNYSATKLLNTTP